MTCSQIQQIRNTCGTVLGGLKLLLVRDFDSFNWLQIIGNYSADEYGNTYNTGTYTNISVYNETQDTITNLTATITVDGSGYITSLVINNLEGYYTANAGEYLTFPDLVIDVDNNSPVRVIINSLTNSATKYTIIDNILMTNGRSVNDFGETVSQNWYQIEFIKGSAIYNVKETIDLSTGANSWDTELSVLIPKRGDTENLNLLIAGQRPIVAIVQDWNNNWWMSGLNNSLQAMMIDRNSGTKMSDPNNTKITFKGTDNHSEVGGFTDF